MPQTRAPGHARAFFHAAVGISRRRECQKLVTGAPFWGPVTDRITMLWHPSKSRTAVALTNMREPCLALTLWPLQCRFSPLWHPSMIRHRPNREFLTSMPPFWRPAIAAGAPRRFGTLAKAPIATFWHPATAAPLRFDTPPSRVRRIAPRTPHSPPSFSPALSAFILFITLEIPNVKIRWRLIYSDGVFNSCFKSRWQNKGTETKNVEGRITNADEKEKHPASQVREGCR